jgi:hypothetical protein
VGRALAFHKRRIALFSALAARIGGLHACLYHVHSKLRWHESELNRCSLLATHIRRTLETTDLVSKIEQIDAYLTNVHC